MKFYRLLPALSFVGLTANAFAQQGSFDVQLSLKKMDCATAKAEVQVQVRAKDGQNFDMGDANYRFEYDANLVKNPKIVSQDNFSNQAAKRDLNYGIHNLQGSREVAGKGIVSLNTFFSGSNAGSQKVSTQWMPVSTLSFDVKDFKTPIELKWHDDKTFPISGMNQVQVTEKSDASFEYDLRVVKASGSFSNLNVNPAAYCKNASPQVAAVPMRVRKNDQLDATFPIYDADEIDDFTPTIVSIGHGQVTPSVKDRKLTLSYMPEKDFIGQDETVVDLTDRYGNTQRIVFRITVKEDALKVFNGFSPNNDGKNDFFIIEGIEKFAENTVSIYDFHGKELYKTIGYKNNWDGKTDGKLLMDGTYFYVIDDGEGQTYSGYVQIVH
jgi:gliding motility-associated-like protein